MRTRGSPRSAPGPTLGCAMSARTHSFDLAPLNLRAGEARRAELEVPVDDFEFGGQTYVVSPSPLAVRLDITRMVGGGWSLRLRFDATLEGPCMRCLEPASPTYGIDAREVDVPEADPPSAELESPYVENSVIDVAAWTRDALALALGPQILHDPDCRGLCPECGVNLNLEPDHEHERAPDPRWAALRDLKLD